MNGKKFQCCDCGKQVDIIRDCLCLYCNKCQDKESQRCLKYNDQPCGKQLKQHLKILYQFCQKENKENIYFSLFRSKYKEEQLRFKKKNQLQRIVKVFKKQDTLQQENDLYYKQEQLLLKVLKQLALTNQIQQKNINIKFLISQYSFYLNQIFTREPSYQTKSIVQFQSSRVVENFQRNNFLKKSKLKNKSLFRSKSLNKFKQDI